MGTLHQNESGEDAPNSEQTVRVRISLAGMVIALSLLAGAGAGVVAYRYAARSGNRQATEPAPVAAAAAVVEKPAVIERPTVIETPAVSNRPAVQRIDPQLINGNLQLIITLDLLVPYDAHRLDDPDRVYVDLHGARLTPELAGKTAFVNKDGLSDIRVAQTQPDTVRVVLDLGERFDYSVTQQTNPAALVLKLMPHAPRHRKRRPAASPPKKTSPS